MEVLEHLKRELQSMHMRRRKPHTSAGSPTTAEGKLWECVISLKTDYEWAQHSPDLSLMILSLGLSEGYGVCQ